MLTTQYGNYVKFIRATEATWQQLTNENKSSDTLYFITNVGENTGKLYLGAKLISNGGLSSATSLSELNDVLVAENITDQSILVYNDTSKKWESKSVLDIFEVINQVFSGASAENDGTAGLVPAPKAGQEGLFLRGDATWGNPTEEIQKQITTVIGDDLNKSMREVAQDEATAVLTKIVDGAPEKFDTLKEIAQWIEDNQDAVDVSGLTNRVKSLEDVINGTDDGTTGLVEIVNSLQTTVDKHTTEIEELQNALKWQDITISE